ncbi:MAG: D-2-hydroxyacid dehydrogenase [Steroidobacteraceae bacterium]
MKLRRLACATLLAIASSAASAAESAVSEVISRLRVQEAAAPVNNSPRWRAPRKVLLLSWSNPAMNARVAELRAAAPGALVVTAANKQQALAEAIDADVIVGANPDVCDPQILAAAKELRWLQSLSAGVELCMRVPAIRAPNLLVTNMRGVDSPVIAEHAIAMMLALAHGLDVFARDTAQAIWSRENAARTQVQMLDGKTLLVVGLGGIGTEVAQRANALGMKVIATREGSGDTPSFVSQVAPPGELLNLARTADVIVSCVPDTPTTRGMYDARFFAALKPSALFLNVARGTSVVTSELVKALNEKRLAGAGLDVVDPEPLPPEHPLWKSPRVLISPHISARSDLPGNDRWTLLTENLRRYVAGGKMLQVVDVQRGY